MLSLRGKIIQGGENFVKCGEEGGEKYKRE
jgi:hypothetical protein